jgi:hypothetical protein
MLALVVEDALAPALGPRQRVHACTHVVGDVSGRNLLRTGSSVAVEQRALICPMHPGELLCDEDRCVRHHHQQFHADDDPTAYCFVCEIPVPEEVVTPVWGVVQLHRAVPLFAPTTSGRYFTYSGELWTLPVTYLCPRHSGLVEVPIRVAWPTRFPGGVGQ